MAAVAVAWGDNALAHHSKTCMLIRAYKAAHRKAWLEMCFGLATTSASEPCARTPDHPIMPTKRKVIAVIDDNLSILGAMSRLLSAFGYDTELYASAGEFLDAAMTTEAMCLIVDIELGKNCGIGFARHLAGAGFTIPIIFMSADDDESVKKRAMDGPSPQLRSPAPARACR